MAERYYHCWGRLPGRRRTYAYIVRAESSADARWKLRERLGMEVDTCVRDSCRAWGICNIDADIISVDEWFGFAREESDEVADASVRAVLYYMKPRSAAVYMCRSRTTGHFMFCWEHEVEYWRRKGYEIVEL